MKNKKILLCLIPLLLTACNQKTADPIDDTTSPAETTIEEAETVQTVSEKRDANTHWVTTMDEVIDELTKAKSEEPKKISAKPQWVTTQVKVEDIMTELVKERAEGVKN